MTRRHVVVATHPGRHLAVASLLGFASWLAAETAIAQTIMQPTVTRRGGHDLATDKINREDCVEDESILFGLNINTAGVSYQVAAWVGAVDCNVLENRTGSPPACTRVFYELAVSPTMEVRIKVRDIIAGSTLQSGVATPETVCTSEDRDRTPTGVTVHFLLVNNSGVAPDGFVAAGWPVNYDVRGPSRPTRVHAGIGERALVVDWNEPKGEPNINGYKVCWEALGTTDTDGGTTDDAGTSDDAGADAGGGGESGDDGSNACASTLLVPGDPPDDPPTGGVHCKTVSGGSSTTGEAKPLTNGTRYVLAVAAIDDYENTGDLSSLKCATPEPVTGFYEAYRAAGGGAGGGYCAIGATPSRLSAAGIALAAVGLVMRRIRRRAVNANVRGAA